MFVKRDTPSPGGSDRSKDGVHCDLCGSSNPAVRCDKCSGHMFCLSCDDMYHRHPKRKQHLRKAVDSVSSPTGSNARPPQGQRSLVPGDPSKMPIPPPRKKKGKSFFPSFGSSNNEIPALPKKEFSITEKLGSIRRFMSNRPLPPIPKDEIPLKGVLVKPPGYQPESSPMSDRRNMDRALNKPGSPQYQNIMAHLTKVAQNSADEWDEDPSVSTSGSTRGSSGGDDIGWGQDINPPPKGVAPPLRGRDGRSDEDWRNFGSLRRTHAPLGGMLLSTSMVDLQSEPVLPAQPLSPSFYPAPYPHFYAPHPGMVPQGYPGGFANFPSPYYRGSWSNLRRKEGAEEEEENEEGESRLNDGTLTRDPRSNTLKSQMKRSQSVMHDPMMVPNAMFPFGAYPPGYPNTGYFQQYWQPQVQQHLSTPPSPTPSTRSLTRMNNRERRRKDYQQQRGDDSASSSSRSRESSSRRRSRGHKSQQPQHAYDSSEQAASSEGEPQEDRRRGSKEGEPHQEERRRGSKQDEQKRENGRRESKEDEAEKNRSEAEESEEDKGPPPIPTMQWECTFCTFINQAGTRVCTICCKTMSHKKSKDEEEEEVEEKKPSKSKSKHKKEEAVEFSAEIIKEQEELEKEIRRQIEATLKLRGGSPGERESQISLEAVINQEGESSVDAKPQSSSPAISSPHPPSPSPAVVKTVTVAATDTQTDNLEILAPTNQSTVACETQTQQLGNKTEVEENTRSDETSTTTIVPAKPDPTTKTDSSCQTNGDAPQRIGVSLIHSIGTGPDNASDVSPVDSLNVPATVETGTSPLPSDNFLGVNMQRSNSQRSLREESPSKGPPLNFVNRAPLLRSLSRASLTSEPAIFSSRDVFRKPDTFDFDSQRRNEPYDWRRRRPSDWTNRNNISKSQFLGAYDSGFNREEKPGQNYRMSMEDLAERKRQEAMHAHGLEMVRLIRKAEQHGFLPDDVQVALNHCSTDQDPIEWLEENWTNMIETVVTLATNYGHDKPENDVGIVSAGEAKSALRLHKGNIWASVTECVETRQRKFIELSARGNFTRREIIAALTANNGNTELSYSELTRTAHKAFTMNVWGPGSGVENMDRPEFLMPEYNRQNSHRSYLEPFGETMAQKMFPYMEHRKGNTNSKDFHRSMLNINLESSMAGYSPNLGRRFSFSSGQRPDLTQRPTSTFGRFQPAKSNYDASDSMSMTSEDFEHVDASFRGAAGRAAARNERKSRKAANKRRSTSFLDKLATLRKDRTKPAKTAQLDAEPHDYDLDSSEVEPQPDTPKVSNEKPRKKSFLNRLLNRSPPREATNIEPIIQPVVAADPLMASIQHAPAGYGTSMGSRMSIQLGDLDREEEVSPMEKVQAFLDIMPEDRSPVEKTAQPERKGGILSRLGFKSSKLSLSSKQEEKPKVEVPQEGQSTFYVEDDGIFEDQDLSIYQGFINLDHILQPEDEDEPELVDSMVKPNIDAFTPAVENAPTEPPAVEKLSTAALAIEKTPAAEMLPQTRYTPNIDASEDQLIQEIPVKKQPDIEQAQPEPVQIEPKPAVEPMVTTVSKPPVKKPIEKQSEVPAKKKVAESEILVEIKETISSETVLVTRQVEIPSPEPRQRISQPASPVPIDDTQKVIQEAVIHKPEAIIPKPIEIPMVSKEVPAPKITKEPKRGAKLRSRESAATKDITPVSKAVTAPGSKAATAPVTKDILAPVQDKSKPVPKTLEIPYDPDESEGSESSLPPIFPPMQMMQRGEEEVYRPRMGVIAFSGPKSVADSLSQNEVQPLTFKNAKRVESTQPITSLPSKAETSVTESSPSVPQPSVSTTKTSDNKDTLPASTTEPAGSKLDKPKRQRKVSPKGEAVPQQAELVEDISPSREKQQAITNVPTALPLSDSEAGVSTTSERAKKSKGAPRIDQSVQTSDKPRRRRKTVEETEEPTTKSEEAKVEYLEPTREVIIEPEPKIEGTKIDEPVVSQSEIMEEVKPQATEVRRRRRPVAETAESPTASESEQAKSMDDTHAESPKNLPAPYSSRRRRSLSTDRGGYVRVRPTSRTTSIDVDARFEAVEKASADTKTEDEEQSVDSRLKSPEKDEDSKPRLSRSASEVGARGTRLRRQRSISRDRASKGTTPTPEVPGAVAKPSKDSSTNPNKQFHYLKAATAESLRPKGSFVDKRQSSKDGTSPTKESGPLVTTKAPSKAKVEPKQIIDGPAVSSRRIVLDKTIKELQAAGKCENYEQAEMAARLMEMSFDEKEALEAAKECGNLYQAISFLQQDCELCAGKFPVADMVSMVNCTHRACRGCLTKYFTIQIRDRNIMELLCPFCNEPDLSDDDVASDYFNNMDQLLKNLVDRDIHELFHRKLRDRALMKDPLFRWCSQCSSGFIITNPNQKRLLCPDCKAVTCASCRKRWEKQHEGISCEQFLSWKEANDPEVQAAGLAQHLAENGIDCPNCNFRYSLAKGGCMHFRCIQCQYDFCSGCGKPFKMGTKCTVSQFCAKLGLHAHHPRNCLFYLRDKEPTELQKLLEEQNVPYNTKPTEGTEVHLKCQVNEQKETNDGLIDDICGRDVEDGLAGLCRVHYLEYLGGLITKHDIDPVPIFSIDELELVLKRANIKLPPSYRKSDEEYRRNVLDVINESLPLGKIEGEDE